MNPVSARIFRCLQHLKCFDVDIPKVRIGQRGDGGYIMADHRLHADCVAFGVGGDVSFERDIAERGGRVFLHDHTVPGLPDHHERFTFNKLGICGAISEIPSLAPLSHHLAQLDGQSGLTLKIDVEGYEWEVFASQRQDTLERFDQIVVEVHWLERLIDPTFEAKVTASLANLNRQFTLFHVHANNCADLHLVEGFTVASVLELSYVRSSLVRRGPSTQVYPTGLDYRNHPERPDLPLFFFPFLPTQVQDHHFNVVVDRIDAVG